MYAVQALRRQLHHRIELQLEVARIGRTQPWPLIEFPAPPDALQPPFGTHPRQKVLRHVSPPVHLPHVRLHPMAATSRDELLKMVAALPKLRLVVVQHRRPIRGRPVAREARQQIRDANRRRMAHETIPVERPGRPPAPCQMPFARHGRELPRLGIATLLAFGQPHLLAFRKLALGIDRQHTQIAQKYLFRECLGSLRRPYAQPVAANGVPPRRFALLQQQRALPRRQRHMQHTAIRLLHLRTVAVPARHVPQRSRAQVERDLRDVVETLGAFEVKRQTPRLAQVQCQRPIERCAVASGKVEAKGLVLRLIEVRAERHRVDAKVRAFRGGGVRDFHCRLGALRHEHGMQDIGLGAFLLPLRRRTRVHMPP